MPDNTNTPLLNDYKLRYLARTFSQTFFGGLQLAFAYETPCYLYLVQIFVWFLPVFVAIPGSLVMAVTGKSYVTAIVSGFILLIVECFIYLFVFVRNVHSREDSPVSDNFLTEEDEVIFHGMCSASTLEFIVPPKYSYINYFLHPVLSGSLIFLGLLTLEIDGLQQIFSSYASGIVIIIWGWFIICVTNYSLIGKPPKEISSFLLTNSIIDLNAISRSAYIIFLLAAIAVVRDSYDDHSTSNNIQLSIYVVFLCCPILWLLGMLPRIDGFVVWLLEQIHIVLLGGSQVATLKRLVILVVFSFGVVVVAWIIPNCIVCLLVLSTASIILSLDMYSVLSYTYRKVYEKSICGNPVTKINKSSGLFPMPLTQVLLAILLIVSTGVIAALTYHFQLKEKNPFYILTIIVLLLNLIAKVLASFQKIYWFGIFKNPLRQYIKMSNSIKWTLFSMRVIVIPLILVLLASIFVNFDVGDCNKFLFTLMTFRVYRKIWLDPVGCSDDMILFAFLNWLDVSMWQGVTSYTQLFIVSLALRTLENLFNKIGFAFSLLVCSLKQPRYQRWKVLISFILSMLFFPFTFAVFILSSALSLPILPLFTLPFYFMAPPKLSSIWPNCCNMFNSSQSDWAFYGHLNSTLMDALKTKAYLLDDLTAGSFYLLRFQDRLILVSILEKSLFKIGVVIKGLELQETSCHSTEAQMIDDIIESNINSNSFFNKYMLSAIKAKTFISFETYSDAKNVLVGIIDNKDFTYLLSKIFIKVMIKNLLMFCQEKSTVTYKELYSSNESPINTQLTSLTPDDLDSSIIVTTSFGTRTINSGIQKKLMSYLPKDDKTESTDSPDSGDMLNPIENILRPNFDQENKDAEDDDEFGNFGFGDSSSFDSDVSLPFKENENTECQEREALISMNLSINSHLQPFILPLKWTKKIPFSERQLSDTIKDFPIDWFQYVLGFYTDHSTEVLNEQTITWQYKMLVSTCYNLLEILPLNNDTSIKAKAILICQIFHGVLPWSPHVSFLEDEAKLKDIVVSSYRMAFKIAYDYFVGSVDISNDEDLFVAINDCEKNWVIGPENDEKWTASILDGVPNLLSISHDKQKNVFKSRLLTKQLFHVPIFEVQKECVLGIWSALALEMFYMTNDDDERYSIQALPGIFRNILIQSADPPLGYPIYSSGIQSVNIL